MSNSEITRRMKISEALKGHKVSEETRRKIGLAQLGELNHAFGKPMSKEQKMKISKVTRGKINLYENNGMWKGDNIGYSGLHKWVKRHFPKPDKCHLCLKVPPKELANITGILNRDFKNWAWFCTKCHKSFDNIQERNLMRGYDLRDPVNGRFIKKNN